MRALTFGRPASFSMDTNIYLRVMQESEGITMSYGPTYLRHPTQVLETHHWTRLMPLSQFCPQIMVRSKDIQLVCTYHGSLLAAITTPAKFLRSRQIWPDPSTADHRVIGCRLKALGELSSALCSHVARRVV